jgi:hypothetical protein
VHVSSVVIGCGGGVLERHHRATWVASAEGPGSGSPGRIPRFAVASEPAHGRRMLPP